MSQITVSEMKLTTTAYPTQWEGKTTDGRFVYARYRDHHLAIATGETKLGAVRSHCYDQNIFTCDTTLKNGGRMTYEQLKDATQSAAIEWPKEAI